MMAIEKALAKRRVQRGEGARQAQPCCTMARFASGRSWLEYAATNRLWHAAAPWMRRVEGRECVDTVGEMPEAGVTSQFSLKSLQMDHSIATYSRLLWLGLVPPCYIL